MREISPSVEDMARLPSNASGGVGAAQPIPERLFANRGLAYRDASPVLPALMRTRSRWVRLMHRLRLEDGVLGVEVSAVERRPGSAHSCRMSSTASSICRMRVELPAVLPVLVLEEAGADPEREPSPADQIDGRGDLGEMRRVAVADGGAERGEADAAGDGGQPSQDGPALEDRLLWRADAQDLDHVVHHREPGEAVVLRPLRLCPRGGERVGGVGAVEPGGVVDPEREPPRARRPCDLVPADRSWSKPSQGECPALMAHWTARSDPTGRVRAELLSRVVD